MEVTILYKCNMCDNVGMANTNVNPDHPTQMISEQLYRFIKKIHCGHCNAPTNYLKHKDAIYTHDLKEYYSEYVKKYSLPNEILV
jgi:hypothetical protein